MAAKSSKYQTATSDVEGYTRIKHQYTAMCDGVELCANHFLPFAAPKENQKVPVICSWGPCGKDIHASKLELPKTHIYAEMYKHIKPLGPDAVFELCEPLIWCKNYGYALLRVDIRDLYDIVEWAAEQSWSSGKVAFSGISYFGMAGYWTAMQKPSHLTCVMSYESACSPHQDGPLSESELIKNRVNYLELLTREEYPTDGPWAILEKVRKLSDIDVPFYTAGNWTDPELHLPGNIRSFNEISSKHSWLEMHTGNHLGAFYDPEHIALQKKFLDYFLFDRTDNGMLEVPRIRLLQHHGVNTFYRENEVAFPPPDAEDVSLYLTTDKTLFLTTPTGQPHDFVYQAIKDNLTFDLDNTFSESFELLGSPYLDLDVSTEAKDLDLFVYLRAIDEKWERTILKGNHGEPMDSFARGYFRLSHRDELAKDFAEKKVLSQPQLPASEVVRDKVYSVKIPLYPAAFLFDKRQKLSLEIGSINLPAPFLPCDMKVVTGSLNCLMEKM